MGFLEIVFWVSLGCVAYTYLVYPLLLGVVAKWRPRPVHPVGTAPCSFSVVLAVRNEAPLIDRRLRELLRLASATGLAAEIIVVSDGSDDETAVVARTFDKHLVRVLELPESRGKAAALTAGCAAARCEILVFADVRQTWASDALTALLRNFADPTVGAVSGDLIVESVPGVMAGIGLYWRLEKWMRRKESEIASLVGVTGAISAVRRELFRPIPEGTLLDDVYWPLRVAMDGGRVVHDPQAHAYDCLPPRALSEFRRKVRTLSGNLQLLTRLPSALLPWRNPLWFQLVSHKLMRLVVPWALLAILLTSALLPGAPFAWLLGGQLFCYALAALGLTRAVGPRSRLAAGAGSFLVLNGAAALALWVWLSGRSARSWRKVAYASGTAGAPGAAPTQSPALVNDHLGEEESVVAIRPAGATAGKVQRAALEEFEGVPVPLLPAPARGRLSFSD